MKEIREEKDKNVLQHIVTMNERRKPGRQSFVRKKGTSNQNVENQKRGAIPVK